MAVSIVRAFFATGVLFAEDLGIMSRSVLCRFVEPVWVLRSVASDFAGEGLDDCDALSCELSCELCFKGVEEPSRSSRKTTGVELSMFCARRGWREEQRMRSAERVAGVVRCKESDASRRESGCMIGLGRIRPLPVTRRRGAAVGVMGDDGCPNQAYECEHLPQYSDSLEHFYRPPHTEPDHSHSYHHRQVVRPLCPSCAAHRHHRHRLLESQRDAPSTPPGRRVSTPSAGSPRASSLPHSSRAGALVIMQGRPGMCYAHQPAEPQ